VNWAQEGWRVLILVRAIPPVGALLATIVLFVVDALTVASAASVALALGLLSSVPLLATVRWRGRLRFERALAAEGLSFGSKASLFSIATMANARLNLRQPPVAWGREFLRTLRERRRRERSR
jgi:hypothetical protein